MFKIADGRDYFYQWDMDRQVTVEDPSIVEVHFCNRTDECSLVVDVVDGLANVPNIILTNSFDIRVFGYDGKATRYDEVFKVKPRTKPADYVYVETEARKFDELMAKADEAITLANEITEYVENNRLDFVDDGNGNVELKAINPEGGGGEGGNTDLTGYATEQWVKDQGYLTEHQNLDEYAKKSDIPTDYLTSIPAEYITESELNDKGYLTEHQSLEGYAKTSDIPDVSTFVTETEVNTAIQNALNNIGVAEGGAY